MSNINKKLVALVQEGTHCVDNTGLKEESKILPVMALCFSQDTTPTGDGNFYWANRNNLKIWNCDDILPIGLTPIPLDDFFKEEEGCTKPNCDCIEIAEQKNGGDPVKNYPCLAKQSHIENALTPSQPSLEVDMDKLYEGAFDAIFDFETILPKYYSVKEMKHDIIEAIKQGIEDYISLQNKLK